MRIYVKRAPTEAPDSNPWAVKRLYPRFKFCHREMASLTLPNIGEAPVVNFGLGGCSVFYPSSVQISMADAAFVSAKLRIFDQEHWLDLKAVSTSPHGPTSFVFRHTSSLDAEFLLRFSTYLQLGSKFESEWMHCEHPDEHIVEPSEKLQGSVMLIERELMGKVDEMVLHFSERFAEYEFRLTNDSVQTLHNIGQGGELVESHLTDKNDRGVLQKVALILSGALSQKAEAPLSSALSLIMNYLAAGEISGKSFEKNPGNAIGF